MNFLGMNFLDWSMMYAPDSGLRYIRIEHNGQQLLIPYWDHPWNDPAIIEDKHAKNYR